MSMYLTVSYFARGEKLIHRHVDKCAGFYGMCKINAQAVH